jgi:hypothetical protein
VVLWLTQVGLLAAVPVGELDELNRLAIAASAFFAGLVPLPSRALPTPGAQAIVAFLWIVEIYYMWKIGRDESRRLRIAFVFTSILRFFITAMFLIIWTTPL